MIEYHNPEAQVRIDVLAYKLSVPVSGANAVSIGFLANGFPDSENFLQALGDAMQTLEPGIESHFYNKGNASVQASEEMLNQIRGECQAVVAAYGH